VIDTTDKQTQLTFSAVYIAKMPTSGWQRQHGHDYSEDTANYQTALDKARWWVYCKQAT